MVAKRGLRLTGSVVAVVVAIGVFPVSSKAGENDNCCTSLEDSITKLEEQTKKHDSSKAPVTVSGWVTEFGYRLERWQQRTSLRHAKRVTSSTGNTPHPELAESQARVPPTSGGPGLLRPLGHSPISRSSSRSKTAFAPSCLSMSR